MEEKRKAVSPARSNAGNTHMAGEMFVAAELAKRGYSVSLTMGNAKAVDLFAERNGRAICVQVKAIAHKRNVGWPLPFDKSKIIDRVLYVCVVLNEIGVAPTYYVLPPNEVRERGRWYETRATLDIGRLRGGGFEGAWHLIDEALTGLDSLADAPAEGHL
ncbi:hypothetical protein LNAOJCKE_2250 [Methylorubrum aminovorans]|uniref:Holliday junction resolvase n=1 Tax=Methylorubrum aminovorans TaxID=269069 RepID=A0ABQ4UD24_9HYPH|nr:hypothetical protein [Methylorubrum aminovorans]GJE65042.1 hypothetical protein LNAOJCKE_2250 [Methylorubrum aminovorans]GMA74537.1 hypothetical protein GCM10025880_09540 [Methylorubrum aminovorans]